ncbi:hypothetical protein ABZV75_09585 [Streptomyces flaveolus]|uniref:hypothetical protein n=1 Tax=Streptomyces flaveolus TaxID=67297 RepID=UPI00339FBBBD
MTGRLARPEATGGRYPRRFKQSAPKGRHPRAHAVVAAWVVLALLAAAARQSLPVARWPAIHLFLLGADTTAVTVRSEHFAVALLHARHPDERGSDARPAAVNLAVAGALGGVRRDWPALTGVTCALLAGVLATALPAT